MFADRYGPLSCCSSLLALQGDLQQAVEAYETALSTLRTTEHIRTVWLAYVSISFHSILLCGSRMFLYHSIPSCMQLCAFVLGSAGFKRLHFKPGVHTQNLSRFSLLRDGSPYFVPVAIHCNRRRLSENCEELEDELAGRV